MTFINQFASTTTPISTSIEKVLVPDEDESNRIKRMEQNIVYSKDELSELGIIHQGMDERHVATAFRNLRTSLLKQMDDANSCILISAIEADGGASFTSTNLAAAFCFDHKKTALLIDCNFDKSALSEVLGVETVYGLKDYINGKVDDIKDIVYPTVVPRLRLVPCGGEKGELGEYFTGRKMKTFIDEVKSRYSDRVIVINAPPILESADTQILTELCDYTVFVLPYGKVSSESVNKAIKAVEKHKIAGFIINN